MSVPTYPPQNAVAQTDRNWIATQDAIDGIEQNLFHAPEFYPELVRRFGTGSLSGIAMLMIDGGYNPVGNIVYHHREDDRLHSKIMCQAHAAGGANATVTLTVASGWQYSYPTTPNSPYTGPASPIVTNPVLNNMIVMFPDGTQASVSNRASTTFDVTPIVLGENIPQVFVTTEISIIGNRQEEGDTQPLGRNWRTFLYTSNLQTMAYSATATGQEAAARTWLQYKNPPGGAMGGFASDVWFLEQQFKTYMIKQNEFDVTLRVQEKSTNPTAMGASRSGLTTEGVYPFIQNNGNVQEYDGVIGYQLSDIEYYIENQLLPNYGANENMWLVGIALFNQISRFIRAEMKEGAIQYNAFKGGKDQAVNFSFNSIMLDDITFHIKTDRTLSDPTMFGPNAFYNPKLGVIIPSDRYIQPLGEDKTQQISVPSFRINYLKAGNYSRNSEEWLTGAVNGVYTNQTDTITCNYRFQRGPEMFAGNRYGIQFPQAS